MCAFISLIVDCTRMAMREFECGLSANPNNKVILRNYAQCLLRYRGTLTRTHILASCTHYTCKFIKPYKYTIRIRASHNHIHTYKCTNTNINTHIHTKHTQKTGNARTGQPPAGRSVTTAQHKCQVRAAVALQFPD